MCVRCALKLHLRVFFFFSSSGKKDKIKTKIINRDKFEFFKRCITERHFTKVLCSLKMPSDTPDDKTRPLFIHDHKRLLSFHSPELKRHFPPTIGHVGTFGCTLLAFIPIDVKISRHIGFNNDEFRKENENDPLSSFKRFQSARASLFALIRSQDDES